MKDKWSKKAIFRVVLYISVADLHEDVVYLLKQAKWQAVINSFPIHSYIVYGVCIKSSCKTREQQPKTDESIRCCKIV